METVVLAILMLSLSPLALNSGRDASAGRRHAAVARGAGPGKAR